MRPNRYIGFLAFAVAAVTTGAPFLFFPNESANAFTIGSAILGPIVAAVVLLTFARRNDRGTALCFLSGFLLTLGQATSLAFGVSSGIFGIFIPWSFVPLVVWFFTGRRTKALIASLAAIAAALLIFPFNSPHTFVGWFNLLLPVLGISAAVVLTAFARRRHRTAPTFAAACIALGYASALAIAALVGHRMYRGSPVGPTWYGTLHSAVELIAICIAMARVSALRYAAYYPAATLVLIGSGYVFFFRDTSFRMWLGLVLMIGAVVGLWQRDSEKRTTLRLR